MGDCEHGSCCGFDRRVFLAGMGAAAGIAAFAPLAGGADTPRVRTGATVRAVFLYPPSKGFAANPNGWWSWPGNMFGAEGRQKMFTTAFARMSKELGMTIVPDARPVATAADARRVAAEIGANPPDGLLLVMFYNRSLSHADLLLQVAEKTKTPTVFYIGLGVKHGAVTQYRRPGVYFIQSLDNLDAIASGMRMINTRKLLRQSRLLSITEAKAPRQGVEAFLGVTVRVIPFARYAKIFEKVPIDREAKAWIRGVTGGTKDNQGVTAEAVENAARAHFALKTLLAEEDADGLTMKCLQRGMLKPCMSFSALNDALIPAACENDFPAAYTQLLGQLLTGRPGFQHNPCFDTESNHYYASHCTCPTRLQGPEGSARPYGLRRFAHTNEGSCAVQVFWNPGDPVTMVRYYAGKAPALDVYAGEVVKSHPMPPAGGCTTNVEIALTDRPDAFMVRGHHNLLFCGDFARRFRLFAQLHRMRLAETGYKGPWPL